MSLYTNQPIMAQQTDSMYQFFSSNGLFKNEDPTTIKELIQTLYTTLMAQDRSVLLQLRTYFNTEVSKESVFDSVPFSTESEAYQYKNCNNVSNDSIHLDNLLFKETSGMRNEDLSTEIVQKILIQAFAA